MFSCNTFVLHYSFLHSLRHIDVVQLQASTQYSHFFPQCALSTHISQAPSSHIPAQTLDLIHIISFHHHNNCA